MWPYYAHQSQAMVCVSVGVGLACWSAAIATRASAWARPWTVVLAWQSEEEVAAVPVEAH